jgi:gamma-glutamyltranspeptidase/glutathione hydrolase
MRAALAALALLALAGGGAAAQIADPGARAPEAATGHAPRAEVRASKAMVVAAHPLAAAAGREMLASGGSAVDAAIAAVLVLNLVEPQSAGLGGGAFLVHYEGATRQVTTFDGRETAPASVDTNLFNDAAGKPRDFLDVVTGGAATGVPGLLAMLELAHARHGRLPWDRLVQPALTLAENGYPVGARLASMLAGETRLAGDPAARALFYRADGTPKQAGETIVNPEFAATLRMIATEGPTAFYRPPFATRLADAVRAGPNPGHMTVDDIAAYRAVERAPACGTFRTWRICGMGPPSSGGVAVAQIMGLIDRGPKVPLDGEDGMALVAEAMRLAYADRDMWLADPDRVNVPMRGLLDPRYLDTRARLIRLEPGPRSPAPAGEPTEQAGALPAPAPSREVPSTTHLSVVDAEGDTVALTASIENAFGARRMVGGFLLNNQLTDFAEAAEVDGRPVANRIEGGKRPRSSMSPTIVLDADDRLKAVLGSPGGARIPGFVATTLVAMLALGDGPQAAVARPHYLDRNTGLELEAGTPLADMAGAFAARGYKVRTIDLNSGLHAIERVDDGYLGGADPRREGAAMGLD